MKKHEQAFPSAKKVFRAGYETQDFEPTSGMTLRDYFAAKAMQALIASQGLQVAKHTPEGTLIIPARQGIPPLAFEYADAMLKAREE